jgi:copper(I)-binding protein
MKKSFPSLFALFLTALAMLPASADAAGSVSITHAWTRALPAGASVCAVYMTVSSPTDDRLLGASSAIAAKATFHIHEIANGVATMQAVDHVDIAGGTPFVFAPLGYHVMLTGLKAPLSPGQHFALSLRFEKAGVVVVDVSVHALRTAVMAPPTLPMTAMPGMDTSK